VIAHVIQVIETETCEGEGTDEDPKRIVRRYWDFDGECLFMRDEWAEKKRLEEFAKSQHEQPK